VPFRYVRVEPHLIRFTAGPLMHVRFSVHSSWALLIVTRSPPQIFMHVCIHACAYISRSEEALALEGHRKQSTTKVNQSEHLLCYFSRCTVCATDVDQRLAVWVW
jgi:hypothetical protein